MLLDAIGDLHHENWDRRLCDSSCPIDFCRFHRYVGWLWGAFLLPLEGGASSKESFCKLRLFIQISIRLQYWNPRKLHSLVCWVSGSTVSVDWSMDLYPYYGGVTSYSNSQLQGSLCLLVFKPKVRLLWFLDCWYLHCWGLGFPLLTENMVRKGDLRGAVNWLSITYSCFLLLYCTCHCRISNSAKPPLHQFYGAQIARPLFCGQSDSSYFLGLV